MNSLLTKMKLWLLLVVIVGLVTSGLSETTDDMGNTTPFAMKKAGITADPNETDDRKKALENERLASDILHKNGKMQGVSYVHGKGHELINGVPQAEDLIVMDLYEMDFDVYFERQIKQRISHAQRVILALEFLARLLPIFEIIHANGIIYRDAKFDNFMVSVDEYLKITGVTVIDFGLAHFLKGLFNDRSSGNPLFASVFTHCGLAPRFRDDIVGLIYMAYLMVNNLELPWGLKRNGVWLNIDNRDDLRQTKTKFPIRLNEDISENYLGESEFWKLLLKMLESCTTETEKGLATAQNERSYKEFMERIKAANGTVKFDYDGFTGKVVDLLDRKKKAFESGGSRSSFVPVYKSCF